MAEQRLGDQVGPEMLSGYDEPADPPHTTPRSRRGLWIGAGAILVIAGASTLLGLHLKHDAPPGLKTPQHLAGLTLDNTSSAQSTADYLRSAFAAGVNMQTSVGAVYTDGDATAQADAHSVIFIGGTATGSDATLLSALLSQLNDSTDGISGVTAEAPGPLGGVMKCGLATDTSNADTPSDDEMAVCAFADSGDIGIALFPNRTIAQATGLMLQIRSGVQ